MHDFKKEWHVLFRETILRLNEYNEQPITLSCADEIMISSEVLVTGSRAIIDDTLLWCLIKAFVIIYFRCVCQIFQKYRVSFKLSKCFSSPTELNMLVMIFYVMASHLFALNLR